MAVDALKELGMHRKVQLIVSGGIRTGADVAKALAMGADAVSIGSAAMVALGCNKSVHVEDYQALGTAPGYCHHCHTGRCPVGITTQDPILEDRLKPEQGARWLSNYLTTLMLEVQTIARACGKSHVLNLEPQDMVALTIEAAAMARIPLAGTNWIPGFDSQAHF
jgi:glutamate synthase domain-containing protein 2